MKESICSDYRKGIKVKMLCEKYRLKRIDIVGTLNENLGLSLNEKATRKYGQDLIDQRNKIAELWDKGLGISEIGNELDLFSTDVSQIVKQLKKEGRAKNEDRFIFTKVRRKYTIDDEYFEKIDTEEKAYFLGLLYADGCLCPNHNSVKLFLKYDDVEILEKFKTSIGSDKPLIYIKAAEVKGFKNSIENRGVRKPQWGMCVTNEKFRKNCENKGLTTRKSLTLKFPTEEQVPKELMRHFIRGYFDGDGTINLPGKSKSDRFAIISTYDFCKTLKEIIERELSINVIISNYINKVSPITKYASVYGRMQLIKLYDYLYKDSTVFFKRKYDRFTGIKNKKGHKKYRNTNNYLV